MSDESIPAKLIRLFTEYPLAGSNDGDFALELPSDISEKCYAIIVERIEFRRKCMNQGFDNLLELLEMHRRVLRDPELQPAPPAQSSPSPAEATP